MSPDNSAPSVLIAEDEAIVAFDLSRELTSHGYSVVGIVNCVDEVVSAVQAHRPSVVLMDIRFRTELDGVTLAEEIFVCEDTPVVFLTAFSDLDVRTRAVRSGAYGFLTKPVTPAALVATLAMAIQKHEDLGQRRKEAALLARAIDAVDCAVIGLDDDGSVRFMNGAAMAVTGSSELTARASTPPWAREMAAKPEACHTVSIGCVEVQVRRTPAPNGGFVCTVKVV